MLHGWTETGLEWIRDAYTRGLSAILHRGGWVLAVALVFLVVSGVFIVPRLPFNFVPTTDSGFMGVSVRLPNGTPTLVANQDVARVENYLMQRPEVVSVQTTIGFAGNITIQLVPVGKRLGTVALSGVTVRQFWRCSMTSRRCRYR